MKYLYYDKKTGMIKIISPVKEKGSIDPFIKVSDNEVMDILAGRKNLLECVVDIQSSLKTKRLIKKNSKSANWTNINEWLYLIPKANSAEFVIKQNCANKTITISLSDKSKHWWSKESFLNQHHITLAACASPDPHHMVWWKNIPSNELLNDVTISYSGTDNIYFYTQKFFESYTHEQYT